MPQLMPLFWNFSILMLLFMMMMLIKLLYELNNQIYNYSIYSNYNEKYIWKW